MPYHPDRHHRHSIRLQNYDYSQAGAYYVTVCLHQGWIAREGMSSAENEVWLGEIVNGELWLNAFGEIVKTQWEFSEAYYPHVELDEHVIMPNHFHGVLVFVQNKVDRQEQNQDSGVGAGLRPAQLDLSTRRAGHGPAPTESTMTWAEHPPAPTETPFTSADNMPVPTEKRAPLGEIMRAFKSFSANKTNKLRNVKDFPVWQRGYYEHIIRNEQELKHIREYIVNNPLKWQEDDYHPSRL